MCPKNNNKKTEREIEEQQMEPIDKEKQEPEIFRVGADTAPMDLSLYLTIGLSGTNFGTGIGVSYDNFGSFHRGERCLTTNNAKNPGAGTDFWLVPRYPPFATASVDPASDLNLELTLSSVNYATDGKGSGASERGTGASNDAFSFLKIMVEATSISNDTFSNNLSVLKKLSNTSKGDANHTIMLFLILLQILLGVLMVIC